MSKQKQTVVSFRVDQHLAEILDQLPDKSEFIREAVLQRFHTVCPYCRGQGVLPTILAEWFKNNGPQYEAVECTCCHYEFPIDLVQKELDASPGQNFICPHCQEHDHPH